MLVIHTGPQSVLHSILRVSLVVLWKPYQHETNPFGVTPDLSPAAVSKSGSGTTSKPASLRARAASRGTSKPPPKPRAAPSSSSTGQRKLPSSSAKGNACHSQHHVAIPAID